MKKYLIEGRYTEGQHEGHTFLLTKGGYVVNNVRTLMPWNFYETERAAKMVATKKTKQNKFDSAYNHYIEPCEYTVKEIEFKGGDKSEGV